MEDSTAAIMLEFGSRGGSYFALALFSSLFGLLGWAIARQLRRGSPELPARAAHIVGGLLFAGPVVLIYASSLGGFYEAEVRKEALVLYYLYPAKVELPLSEISEVWAEPAFKRRWRMYVAHSSGAQYESATWDRESVQLAAKQLRALAPPAASAR